GEEAERHGGASDAEATVSEQAEGQHRVPRPRLPCHERHQREDGQEERARHEAAGPPLVRSFVDAEHEGAHADQRAQGAGPMAPPAPAKPAQMAIARPRSSGGNTAVTVESVAGMTNAAPRPVMPRPTMTSPALPARPLSTAPAAKTPRPLTSASLRPYRSPIAPADSRTPANTSP